MANHFYHLLKDWHARKDNHQWALVSIFNTQGSSYRKVGAHMLVNDMGQCLGMVSGGCLEADIVQQARRCWDNGQNRIIEYDLQNDSDFGQRLGIGCGGIVNILIQNICAENQYLCLNDVFTALSTGAGGQYSQLVDIKPVANCFQINLGRATAGAFCRYQNNQLLSQLNAPYHLGVFGGGIDARPLVQMATVLGWRVSVFDSRPSHARVNDFPWADKILRTPVEQADFSELLPLDAAVLMHHHLDMDARALRQLWDLGLPYLGILGPTHRTQRVAQKIGLSLEQLQEKGVISPVGLRLGGELPESIALSILSQIHSLLEGKDAKPIYSSKAQ